MKNTVFPIITENEQRLPYYIFSIGLDHVQEHILRSAGYPCWQWIQCRSGSGRLIVDGSEMTVAKDQGIFLLPDEVHEYYAESAEDWVVDWVGITGECAANFFAKTAKMVRSGVYFIAQPEDIREIMEQALEAAQAPSPVRSLDVSALAYSLLMSLLKNVSSSSSNSMATRYARLTPVLNYIEEHYAEAITLKELSELLGVTPQHLCTLFRKIMNTRIFEYINLVRIKKSKEYLLEQPDMAIRDVAHTNGFEDVSYFCYIFKRIEKTTPGDFRKLYVRS
jgi:AraC family transcriptional regulator, arabinose operon regulatory protein